MKKAFLASSALAMPAIIGWLPSAYDNTLTAVLPDLYAGLDVVSRELTGYIPSVTRNANGMERAAVGQSIVYHVAPTATTSNVTPAMTPPNPTDKTITGPSLTISKSKKSDFGFTGEEQRGLNTGPGYLSVQADLFAQALRALTNEIEADLAAAAAAAASRAYGTGGTTPFASDTSASAQLRKILDDNGAPPSDRALVLNTTAGAVLRTLLGINANRPAQDFMNMQQGSLVDLHGFVISESGQAIDHTKGTGASATTNSAGYAVGDTVITLASAGTGTIVAGDVITFAGDTNQYVVVSGDADVSNGGTITIAEPGLQVAIAASATNITVKNSYEANVGFARSAMHLVARPPALPQEGDAARDRFMLVDPRSGLPFEISIYAGYRKISAEVAMAWGVKATKTEHIALLMG